MDKAGGEVSLERGISRWRLRRLVAQWGFRWSDIGKEIGRMPLACADRCGRGHAASGDPECPLLRFVDLKDRRYNLRGADM